MASVALAGDPFENDRAFIKRLIYDLGEGDDE